MLTMFCIQAGFSQNLTIIEQDYNKALLLSQQEHKLLLIDFYTTWCGPCKELDGVIFKDPAIAGEIGKQFIVLKYDAERDSTFKLSLKYHISSYPTSLILNTNQMLLNRMYGFGDAGQGLVENYRELLKKAILNNSANRYITGVSNTTDLPYPQFYKDYVYRVNTKNIDDKVKDYWEHTNDYLSEVPFAILCYFQGGTDTVNSYFLNNRKKYEALYGDFDVRFVTSMIVNQKLFAAIKSKDRQGLASAIVLAKANLDSVEATDLAGMMEERMLQSENRWPEAIRQFSLRKEKYRSDESVAAFCWNAYEHSTDQNVLKQCTRWIQGVTARIPRYDVLDTYARLLFKTGHQKQGIDIMKQAIKAGQLKQEDVKSSEDWLKKVASN